MTPRALLVFPAIVAAAYGAAAQPPPLSNTDPFKSASGPASVQAPAETIEFAGVSTIGDKTDLIFFDKAAKKHRWVPLKQTVDGIEALNYDARLDQAVVKINGVQKTLPLRKGSAPVNAPAAVAPMPTGFNTPPPPATMPALVTAPAPVAAPAVATQPAAAGTTPTAPANATPGGAETVAKQEQEARMLVSDLLEIGMAQRKAYEEAQRKAAGGDAAQPAQPAPVQSVPAQPVQTAPAQTAPAQPNSAR
jgi:hypothetical protein